MIRRLHDIGLSGYFVLLALIPLVSLGFMLYILFKKGTDGDNAYGPDPLGAVCAAQEPENPYARGAILPSSLSGCSVPRCR
jgi:inner membrane protein yhaI